MSSPLRSCEEDEGMVVNSEGGDFDEEDDDEGDLDENASDINSPAAPREIATPAAPGTVKEKTGGQVGGAHAKRKNTLTSAKFVESGHAGSSRNPRLVPQIYASPFPVRYSREQRGQAKCARWKIQLIKSRFLLKTRFAAPNRSTSPIYCT